MTRDLPRQVDHYRLEERLGAGGMGVVYRAVDTLLDRPVAIKMMHTPEHIDDDASVAELHERFLREARAAARIRSRFVAQVLQLGTTAEGETYIVMELLRGVSLSRVLARGGRLPPARAVALARHICRGMQAAHDLGIVHRDLKPANVMIVEEEGEEIAKVLDFGVAKLTHEQHTKGLTQAGAVLGTLTFMAPEQISNGPVDPRSDIYALGMVVYRMLTGLPVWDADNLSDIVRHQLMSAPPSMFERLSNLSIPPALDSVVLRCLEKAPAMRWQSMRELGDALERALHASPSSPAALAQAYASPGPSAGARFEARARPTVEGEGAEDSDEDSAMGTSPTGNGLWSGPDARGESAPIKGSAHWADPTVGPRASVRSDRPEESTRSSADVVARPVERTVVADVAALLPREVSAPAQGASSTTMSDRRSLFVGTVALVGLAAVVGTAVVWSGAWATETQKASAGTGDAAEIETPALPPAPLSAEGRVPAAVPAASAREGLDDKLPAAMRAGASPGDVNRAPFFPSSSAVPLPPQALGAAVPSSSRAETRAPQAQDGTTMPDRVVDESAAVPPTPKGQELIDKGSEGSPASGQKKRPTQESSTSPPPKTSPEKTDFKAEKKGFVRVRTKDASE
jgi:serine/threonine protein kinase